MNDSEVPKDFVIEQVGWLTPNADEYLPVERIHKCFRVLLEYLQAHGLTTRTVLPPGAEINDDTKLVWGDLTTEGLAFYRTGVQSWQGALDRNNKKDPADVRLLDKYLRKLREAPS